MENTPTDFKDVLVDRQGHLGHIILNRPKAINALTHSMVTAIATALDAWEHDDAVVTVLISGAGERGLCAGGDIVSIHRDALSGGTGTADFWADEYRLNARIASYPKPYVAIMDGLVLGGGVGISAHGSLRIVTERTKIGMPETGIGFTPDVGGTHLLSQAPGEFGTHLALTAGNITGPDSIALGLADLYLNSEELPEFIRNLAITDAATAVKSASHGPVIPAPLVVERTWVDACYSFDTVEQIIAALRANSSVAAQCAADSIATKSPTALNVTLAALRAARDSNNLVQTLQREYRISLRSLAGHDLAEGIRAQIIDKDRNPQWSPATLAEVSREDIADYFADLGARELDFASQKAG